MKLAALLFLLLTVVACDDERTKYQIEERILTDLQNYETDLSSYSSHDLSQLNLHAQGSHGECDISADFKSVVYQSADSNFKGIDYCEFQGGGCNLQLEVDFSHATPFSDVNFSCAL